MSFRLAIWNVLHQIHPNMSITLEAIDQIDQVLNQLIKHIVYTNLNNYGVLVVSNIKILLPFIIDGTLLKHGISEGDKSIFKYDTKKNYRINESRSSLAGLMFPLLKTERILNELNAPCTELNVVIFITAICEYLCAEILELSGNAARDRHSLHINLNDINNIIKNDNELLKTFSNLGIKINPDGTHITLNSVIELINQSPKNQKSEEDCIEDEGTLCKEIKDLNESDAKFIEEFEGGRKFKMSEDEDEEEQVDKIAYYFTQKQYDELIERTRKEAISELMNTKQDSAMNI